MAGDLELVRLALRARALALTVCTTGVISLASTASGYVRTTGSFLDDGFAVGMEVVPLGFSDLTPRVITSVSALTVNVNGTVTAQNVASGRGLTVGLPAIRALENLEIDPIAGRPFAEEEFVPATRRLLTTTSNGFVELTGLYVWRWYGLANTGGAGIRRCVNALCDQYPEMLGIPLTDSTTLRIRGNPAPSVGAITQRPGGWALCTLTVPWTITARRAA